LVLKIRKDVKDAIIDLIEKNKFTKNFGAKRIISELRSLSYVDTEIPSRSQISNKLSYYRKNKFKFNNEISPLEEKLRRFIFTGDEHDCQPFVYFYTKDESQRLILGDGSDDHPFVSGLTSKKMLSVINTAIQYQNMCKIVLHIDCTFKCNDNEFPVLVIGITDVQQQFHPLSINVISHRDSDTYYRAFEEFKLLLRLIYPDVEFSPDFIMTDCDDSERKAALLSFPMTTHLMCFFHVQKNVKEHLRKQSKAIQEQYKKDVQDLHESIDQKEYDSKYQEIFNKWSVSLPEFANYFDSQWNNGNFVSWKIFNSSPGVATTNNALESFNKTIKKSYTLAIRHTLPALFDIIIDRLIRDVSMDLLYGRKCFEIKRKPTATVISKLDSLGDLYSVTTEDDLLYRFMKNSTQEVHIVEFENCSCSCRYYKKFAYCKHVLFIFKKKNVDCAKIITDRRFKYRGNTRMVRRQRGRVADARPALLRN
jgi:hypothetical protein